MLIDTSTAPGGSALTTPDHVDVTLSPGQVFDLGDFGLAPSSAPSLLPFTGGNVIWFIRFGPMLLAVGHCLARNGRRRRLTVLPQDR